LQTKHRSLHVIYISSLVFLLTGSTIPPVLRFTLLVSHVCVGWLRAAPISLSQLPTQSMGSEPGQLPLAVNRKINISLKHRTSWLFQECLKSQSRLCQLFFICKGEKSFQNWGMGSMQHWDVSLSKLWAGWDVREGFQGTRKTFTNLLADIHGKCRSRYGREL